ncbi:hypothetical protein TD95_000527 [Thielaviopsis punctulata]|uniref:Uncharacterized protein n=1 Tax=Thielaviopsis punctulata TaxID=72032 RepID=A0A0F4ZAU4_9PEZI|nr:hypothetical protein TD95_000527 [Thielaviopsis punctulata]
MSVSSVDIPSSKATGKLASSSRSMSVSSSVSSSLSSSLSSSPLSLSPAQFEKRTRRRQSLLSSAISQQETTHVNIGGPDSPRLISYLSSGQGFCWNPDRSIRLPTEIFIPSYIDYDYVPLELRRDAVHEIHITDEEAKGLLPQ